jgi:ATP-dependent Clp protease ATP-binding subunit ClpA
MSSIAQQLAARVIGQQAAIDAVVPVLRMWEANLHPEGRPAGVFLFLGPTGVGKTLLVEALAEVLHGTRHKHLRVDCGEYSHGHEVAKLIAAPPGYLGHRETKPILSNPALKELESDHCKLSILLFDEIEKAHADVDRLLLGVLDKATLRTGDGQSVDFSRSLIFFTSNVGASAIARDMRAPLGFANKHATRGIGALALSAAKQRWPPEFMNRIDATVVYQPLSPESIATILEIELNALRKHIDARLGLRSFPVAVDNAAKRALIAEGISPEYGARELKRVIQRRIMQPIAALIADNKMTPGTVMRVTAPQGRVCVDLDWEFRGAA